MPVRSGLIVMLRIFAILMLFTVMGYALVVAATFGNAPGGTLLPQIAVASLLLIPILLILWLSGPIVDFLAPRPAETVPDAEITHPHLQAIAFSAVGAFILYRALGETITLLSVWHLTSQMPSAPELPPAEFLQAMLSWAFGIYLLIGGPGLIALIERMRTASPKPD